MQQFIKLPLSTKSEPMEIKALWAIASSYLTVPNYTGALKCRIKNCCKNGSPFEPFYKEFRKKYLKSMLMPNGENHFETRFELYGSPEPSRPTVTYLNAADSRKYILKFPQHRVMDKGYYTALPMSMLRDKNLSLKAKGLYIEIKRLFDLAKNVDDVTVSKDELMKRCKVKRSSIESSWNELKQAGYLHQRRYFDPATGLFAWGYELFDTATEPNFVERRVVSKKSAPIIERETANEVAVSISEREAIRSQIKANIEYDTLIENAGNHEIDYTISDINSYVQLMVDAVCTSRPYIRLNGDNMPSQAVRSAVMSITVEDVLGVIDNLNRHTSSIRNIRAYKLTALYNAQFDRR